MALPDLRLRQGTAVKHHHHHDHPSRLVTNSDQIDASPSAKIPNIGLGIRKRSWSAEYSSDEEDDHYGRNGATKNVTSVPSSAGAGGKKVQLLTQPVNMTPLSPPNICYPSSSSEEESDEEDDVMNTCSSKSMGLPNHLQSDLLADRPSMAKRRKSISNALLARRNSMRRNSMRRRLSAPWLTDAARVPFSNLIGSSQQHAQQSLEAGLSRSSPTSFNLGGYQSGCSASRKRKTVTVPEQDRIARQRCFDYLVSAIDQVWAQYCESTSCAENEKYHEEQDEDEDEEQMPQFGGFMQNRRARPNVHQRTLSSSSTSLYVAGELPCSPVSLDDEPGSEQHHMSVSATSSEGEEQDSSRRRRLSRQGSVLHQPKSMSLMNIKKRLLNAKYFFDRLLDSLNPEDSADFWHRWDLIKYTAIELVEEADDDETIESTSAELERGRTFARG